MHSFGFPARSIVELAPKWAEFKYHKVFRAQYLHLNESPYLRVLYLESVGSALGMKRKDVPARAQELNRDLVQALEERRGL